MRFLCDRYVLWNCSRCRNTRLCRNGVRGVVLWVERSSNDNQRSWKMSVTNAVGCVEFATYTVTRRSSPGNGGMMLSLCFALEACMGGCRDRMSLQATEALCRLLFCLRDVLKNTGTGNSSFRVYSKFHCQCQASDEGAYSGSCRANSKLTLPCSP